MIGVGDLSPVYGFDTADVFAYATTVMAAATGSSSTVTNRGNRRLLDTDGVRRQVEALSAVATAYEKAARATSPESSGN